jgi:cytochrome P450
MSLELPDVTVPPSTWVSVSIGAANRDQGVFDRADTLDIGRVGPKHPSFAHGPHFCLGATLARLEGQVVFSQLFRHELELAGEPVWRRNPILRGLEKLPARCLS